MAATTYIRVSEETKERLKKYGKFGETYDQVLRKILDEYEKLKSEKN